MAAVSGDQEKLSYPAGLRAAIRVMKKYNTGSSSLAYECFGPEDGIPMVFLHGATVDHVSMKNTFEEYFSGLDREYRRVYVDLPGHGVSDYSFFRADVDNMLNEVGAFLQGNFANPPCLVGYSMGGFLALKLAEKTPYPAIFLVAPPVYTDNDRIDKPPTAGPAADELNEEERGSADRRYLLLAAKKTAVTLKRYKANLAAGFSPGRWLYQAKFFHNAASADMTIDPGRIVSRTAFLVGQRDLLVGYRDQFELSSRLKFSEYHSFNDCGHFLPIECPQFGSIFRNWLAAAAQDFPTEAAAAPAQVKL